MWCSQFKKLQENVLNSLHEDCTFILKVLKYHLVASVLQIEFYIHADGKIRGELIYTIKSETAGYRKQPSSAFGGRWTAKHHTRSHDMLNRVQNNSW